VRIEATELAGVFVVDAEPVADDRGTFTRTFAADEFAQHGLDPTVVQCNISTNRRAGTLRGVHWQAAPHGEAKLVRCTRGRIFDVAVDVRTDSPTFRRWLGFELSGVEPRALYLAVGFAHGFISLEPDSEVFYQISAPHRPAASRGFRWDDPAVAIEWPAAPTVLSDRDRSLPMLGDAVGDPK
jgi:dTDP-4-dehydrorhamnose 3,5-epimerase